jgi:hypothetical protein
MTTKKYDAYSGLFLMLELLDTHIDECYSIIGNYLHIKPDDKKLNEIKNNIANAYILINSSLNLSKTYFQNKKCILKNTKTQTNKKNMMTIKDLNNDKKKKR